VRFACVCIHPESALSLNIHAAMLVRDAGTATATILQCLLQPWATGVAFEKSRIQHVAFTFHHSSIENRHFSESSFVGFQPQAELKHMEVS